MDLPSNTLWYNHFFILMRFLNTIYGSIWFGDKGLWLKRSFIIDYLLSCIMYFSTYKHVVLLHTLISYTTRSNTTTDVLYTLNTLVFYSIKNYGVCEKLTFAKLFTTYYLAYQISQYCIFNWRSKVQSSYWLDFFQLTVKKIHLNVNFPCD